MKIITAPHESLRKTADPIVTVDKQLNQFIKELQQTLQQTRNPKGVGLAATQVNKQWRAFATNLDEKPRIFINPEMIDRSTELTLGPKEDEPYLEGCLSIPGIYGPVPRWQWAIFRYDELRNDTLVSREEEFDDFAARLMQHELDHLNGILFTDHSLEHQLPIYKENKQTKKMDEIDPELVALL